MSGRRAKAKRKLAPEKQATDEFADLKRQMVQMGLGSTKVVPAAPGDEKMSDVLETFVEPYLHKARDEHDFRVMYNLAVIAWNVATRPGPASDQLVENVVAKQPDDGSGDREALRDLIDAMIARKQERFAENRRIIAGVDIRAHGDGHYNISVASALPEPAEE